MVRECPEASAPLHPLFVLQVCAMPRYSAQAGQPRALLPSDSLMCLRLQDLSYKDRHWHEACFHCSRCKSSLVDKPFAAKEDQLLCTDCYSHEYSSKCQECKKTIMPGQEHSLFSGIPQSMLPLPSPLSLNLDSWDYLSKCLVSSWCWARGEQLGVHGVVSERRGIPGPLPLGVYILLGCTLPSRSTQN